LVRIFLRYGTLYFLLAISLIAFGQSPHFKNQAIFKGQKGYTVNKVFQDSKGLLWFGTSEGLVLYDGVAYSKFTTEDSLASNNITAIAEDENHNLWVGHKKGKISIVNKDRVISSYTKLEKILNEDISGIIFLGKDRFCVTSLGSGMIDVSGEKNIIHNSESGTADDYIYDIEIDETGKLWLATDVGLICFNMDENKWDKISMEDGLPDNIIKEIEFDKNGRLWIGTEEEGIAIYNTIDKKITSIPNWEFGSLNQFIIRDEGELWISTKRDGVVKLNYKDENDFQYKNYSETDGLISNRTKSIFQDNEGNIWIPSKEGVSQFTGNLFEILNTNGGLPSNQVYGFVIDAENRFWVASVGGLYMMTKSMSGNFSAQQLLNDEKYVNHTYTSIYQSDDSTIWVGTYGYGIYRFNTKTLAFDNFNSEVDLTNSNIISISGDDDNIWFSTSGGGVNYINRKEEILDFKSYSKESGLGSDYLYSVFKDSKERIWFAKDGGGISLLENGKLNSVEGFDTISNVVYGIVEDGLNNVWFTTANEGLIKYDGADYHHFTTKDGLITNSFNSITIDSHGNCVLASNKGITVVDVRNNQFLNYGEDDGVAYLEPNLNAIFKDENGAIWIGTNNGIIKYDNETSHNKVDGVKIYITKKQTLENELTDSDSVLSYDENHLIFNYIGLWYKAPENIVYRYKIEGHDIDWIYAQKSLTATYSGLPSGKYTFKVEATIDENNWESANSAQFYFEIETPFWEKMWFIITAILLVIIGFYSFMKVRVANLKKSEEKLKEEVQKRTAEISKQKDELENNKDIIEQKNKDIMDSIHYAKRIQSAILPPNKFVKEHLPNSFILYKPKDVVAGDFYWMEEKGSKVLFAAADCTGHGVPGAMVSVVCNNALNRSVREHGLDNPGDILSKTREIVIQEFEKSDEEVKDGMDIALCSIDGNKLQYAGAHNPLWIIRNNEIIETKANKQPIGKFIDPKPYVTHNIDLQVGDSFYIFTDGYVDQFGGPKGKKFKTRAFKELLLSIQNKRMDEQLKVIDDAFETWRGDLEQIDDVCVIGVKF
jgi:ligand-binding sensor domain-containing protein/serine phosphatase RsbU (regulator of sigma subunit)